MIQKHLVDVCRIGNPSGLIHAIGDFGCIKNAPYDCKTEGDTVVYSYTENGILLRSEWKKEKSGAYIRRDTLTNTRETEITVYSLLSVFSLSGDDYEIYTQYNGWQNENSGHWQPLATEVTARAGGIRTCEGASPVLAAYSRYAGKSTVFHLLPNAQWKMTARKSPLSEKQAVTVETGFEGTAMHLSVSPNETVSLPAVILYSAENRTDLDAYKLHEIYNRLYPRRKTPVLYNTWLSFFDRLDYDALLREVDTAKELGIEGFMVDAGWFGNGVDWWQEVGDWHENTEFGLTGRLLELADYVRKNGLIFGLWFEAERALEKTEIRAAHPEYFIGDFLDFAREDARNYILGVVSDAVDRYSIGWLKFDFNASIPYDPSGSCFYRYLDGQRLFIEELRRRYPDIYLTNCASGGARMELYQASLFDSFWFTDNQGSYDGVDIIRNSLLRLPSSLIERWSVQKYCEGFLEYGSDTPRGMMLTCNDATWSSVTRMTDAYTDAFLTGGPMCFSSRISEYPEIYKKHFADLIANYKTERDFYRTATARIPVATDALTVFEYADTALDKIVVQIFTKRSFAKEITLFPAVSPAKLYLVGNETLSGEDLLRDGLLVSDLQNNDCVTLLIKAVQK